MTSDLFLAILAMDAYNRARDGNATQGLIVAGNSIGNAVIDEASEIDNVNFFAQSYNIGNQTVIAYRGTDDVFGSNFLNIANGRQ